MRRRSFKDKAKRWYKENQEILEYHGFIWSALLVASILYGFINHRGIFQ